MKISKFVIILGLTTVSFVFLIPYGCKKKNNEPGSDALKKKYAWAVGTRDSTNYSLILFTNDGGETWQRQGEGTTALLGIDLIDVWATDVNDAWAVGTDNSILKTTDGGLTWVRIQAPLSREDINLLSISLSGKNNIWISGVPGIVYNSKDGGSTWTLFDTNFFRHGIMQGIHAIDQQTVYVAGGAGITVVRGFIARTTDGGMTWDSIVPGADYNRNEWIGVKSSDPNHIVIYGVKAHYLYSDDAGSTWKNDSVPNTGGINGADINSLTMVDADTWWGAFDYDGIYLTTNSGKTWTKQPSAGPGAMFLFGIDFSDRDLAIIVAISSLSNTGKILQTTDGGDHWNLKYLGKSWINKVSFIKN